MEETEADISDHPFEEEMEDKSQTSSGLDIDADQEHESPGVPSADKNGADFIGKHVFLGPKVSSSYKNGMNINGELVCPSPKGSSFDENEEEIYYEHECLSTEDSSFDDNGIYVDGKIEGLSPKVSSIDNHGINTNGEPDDQIPKVSSMNKKGREIDEAVSYVIPELGMDFESEDHAYKCYNRFAALEGFSIRKDFVNKSRINGAVVSRRYTCYRQGYRPMKRDMNVKKPRKDTRTGCLAHMTIARQPNGRYRVTHFETKHNHELATPFTAHSLPSQRRITFAQAVEAEIANDSAVTDGIPKLGLGFDSEDHAYEFYNAYAGRVGFSVRKDYVNRSKIDSAVASRRFTCFREGYRQKDKGDSVVKRPRKETRIGCLAQLVIARQPDGKYRVTHFEENHNHELVPACRVRMLRSQRMSKMQSLETNAKDGFDMQSKSASELLCNPAIEQGDFGYHPIDYRSKLLSKCMKEIKQADEERILQYFQSKQLKDPSFFYAVQVDAEDRMINVFWADGKMLVDYGDFGDVVCFDTTHRLNKDCRPFAPFIGVNHHKQMVIFGAVLLNDETIESFKWLFRTFIEAMSGKKPKTILTDQDAVMAEAISSELPETLHRTCVWHVYQNVLNHLSEVIVGSDSFANALSTCICWYDEEEDFINAWNAMLHKYGLWEHEWLEEIFKEREKWAIPYGKHIFAADIRSALLSENINTNLRKYLKSDLDVLQFFKHFGRVVNDWRYKELEANYDMTQRMPRLMGDVIMLKHARDIYTPKIFELFQQEYENCLNVVVNQCTENGSLLEYKVSVYGQLREYPVLFSLSEDSVVCNCMKFQFLGVLCSHALKVLDYRNIKMIPTRYILKRWTKDARV